MPGLDGRRDYDRDTLAADLGLARDEPVLAQAAQAYLAAAGGLAGGHPAGPPPPAGGQTPDPRRGRKARQDITNRPPD